MSVSRETGWTVLPFMYVLWVFSVGAVVALSLLPDVGMPGDSSNADKIGHFFAYLWIALLPALIMKSPKRSILLFAGLVLLGAVLEVGQMYVPGRMFSFADMGANAAGAVAGIFMGRRYRARFWRYLRRNKRPDQEGERT